MAFGRREFLKALGWVLGASQVSLGAEEKKGEQGGQRGEGKRVLEAGDFELIVVGGGLSGVACAISAARNGVKVALVHERSMLGGNSASEVRLYPEDNDAYQPWIRESGIHEEFHLEDRVRNYVRYREGLTNCNWDLILYEWVMREKNLTLFLNTTMTDVVMGGKGRIKAVRAIQLGTEKSFELSAPLFVDATGDGVLGYRAGADFRWGREANSEYGETLGPEVADEEVMGNTLFYRAVDAGRPVPFVRPEWAAKYTEADLVGRSCADFEAGHWWVEVGMPLHPIHDNEKIRHECLRSALGVWDYVKNSGKFPRAANFAMDFLGFWPYKREARRAIGDVVLTQRQVQDPELLEDAVANGAWGIDLHVPGGILQKGKPFIPPHGPNFEKWGTLPYGISLRSLYSRNIENMFCVGRNMSASYLGFCSSRVLSTGCVVGQAAGVAAGVCKRTGKMPRAVAKEHIKEVQQLILRQDGWIPGVVNEDERDLARSATASASSEMALWTGEPAVARALDFPRGQLFPVSGDRIDSVALWLLSKNSSAVEMEVGLHEAKQVWDFRSTEAIATAKASVPAGHDGWVEFRFDRKVEPRKLYWVSVPKAGKVYWKSTSSPRGESFLTPPGCSASQRMGEKRWEQIGSGWWMGVRVTPESRPFGAGNVNSGTHRPDRWTNIWISERKLPAWVELKWEGAKTFNTVVLTFDTNVGRREDLPLFRYPDCVRDYDVEVRSGGGWKKVAEGRGNYMRRREHRFERVEGEAVRINVLATNGAEMARIYEVRVYDEA